MKHDSGKKKIKIREQTYGTIAINQLHPNRKPNEIDQDAVVEKCPIVTRRGQIT
jgi:hypothetical protein